MKGFVLGISAYYHDSAAALVYKGEVVAAAQEERFTRKKHDPSFPTNAIKYVIQEMGITLADIDEIVFYDKPFLKFERLLETYHAFAPQGLRSFLSAMPIWIKEKLFLKSTLEKELTKISGSSKDIKGKILFSEHHLSHAASAFFPSPFSEAAILTIDGVGEWTTTTIAKGEGNSIKIIKELSFPHSIGLLYSAFTYYVGFKVNSGEYKLMGLAPYGEVASERVERFKKIILTELIDLKDDGSIMLNMDYFNFAVGLTMCRNNLWEKIFGIAKRDGESEIGQEYMDLALAIQEVTNEIVLRLAKTAKLLTGCENLVMAGGVALNCVANGELLRSKIFTNIWIQPAAGDAGGALGAALAVWHIYNNGPRDLVSIGADSMNGSYLGPQFTDKEVAAFCRCTAAVATHFQDFNELAGKTASLLSDGRVVGWFQGRMEWGPRALGNRSILGDPRDSNMQKKLNLKIKYREGFRPFAPSVLEEDIGDFFDIDIHSPYMLLVAPVARQHRTEEPESYSELDLYQRLYHIRSSIPAITHVDYSARIQSVNSSINKRYWQLINAFKNITGVGMVVNTSFNVRGEPIVCTPEDAYRCFMRTEMDYLVINNFLFAKNDQPKFVENQNWKELFELD